MKRILFHLFFIATSISCFSQETQKNDLWKGIERFILGTDKSAFVSGFKMPPSFDSLVAVRKRIYSYQYWFSDSSKCIVEEIDFNNAIVNFNSNQKLIGFSLNAIYRETDSTDYFKDAENAIKKLAGYLTKTLKKKGVLTYRYHTKNQNMYSYEWRKKRIIITSRISFHKTNTINLIFLGISFWTDNLN